MATVAQANDGTAATVKLRLAPRGSPDDRIRTFFFFFESQDTMTEGAPRGARLGAASAGGASDVLALENLRLD